MTAEELIQQYLEDKAKFRKQLVKGQPVKKDKMQDNPNRDTDANVDQDITWRSSSKAPYS